MAIYFYIDSKKCKPKCKECGDDGCGCDCDCGSCPTGSSCSKDGLCVAKKDNNCSCKNKTCGFDGCGKSCGTCNEGEICFNGKCYTPDCTNKECGNGCVVVNVEHVMNEKYVIMENVVNQIAMVKIVVMGVVIYVEHVQKPTTMYQ